jgi:beta-phosphoglucomutase
MIQGVIFDFDGVLLDTSNQLYQGYKKIFKHFNIDYKKERFNENYGLKTKEHFKKILSKNNIGTSDEELNKLVEERDIFYKQICNEDLKLLPGAEKLLDELKNKNIKLGLASSTSRGNLNFFLPNLGLQTYFDHVLGGDEVARGKPHPKIYLTICNRLNIEPSYCVGIEDTDKGINALKNANMKAVAVTLTNRKQYDFSKADLIVRSLEELNWSKIMALF